MGMEPACGVFVKSAVHCRGATCPHLFLFAVDMSEDKVMGRQVNGAHRRGAGFRALDVLNLITKIGSTIHDNECKDPKDTFVTRMASMIMELFEEGGSRRRSTPVALLSRHVYLCVALRTVRIPKKRIYMHSIRPSYQYQKKRCIQSDQVQIRCSPYSMRNNDSHHA
jgi:hypothetical protein